MENIYGNVKDQLIKGMVVSSDHTPPYLNNYEISITKGPIYTATLTTEEQLKQIAESSGPLVFSNIALWELYKSRFPVAQLAKQYVNTIKEMDKRGDRLFEVWEGGCTNFPTPATIELFEYPWPLPKDIYEEDKKYLTRMLLVFSPTETEHDWLVAKFICDEHHCISDLYHIPIEAHTLSKKELVYMLNDVKSNGHVLVSNDGEVLSIDMALNIAKL